MTRRSASIAIRSPDPYQVFLFGLLVFQVLPTLYIVFFNIQIDRAYSHSSDIYFRAASRMAVSSAYIYVATAFILVLYRWVVRSRVGGRIDGDAIFLTVTPKAIQIGSLFALFVSALFTVVYGINGGFYKLSLLGSDMDSGDFRFLNFNEVDRVYTYLLQISRRVILPALIFLLIFLRREGVKGLSALIFASVGLQLLAASMTFARAPFMMLLAALILAYVVTAKSIIQRIAYILIGIISVIVVGGMVTKLQYNIVDFSFSDVLITGYDFLVNRAWLVPPVVSINLSFAFFNGSSDSLYLAGSRVLGALSGEVIGTREAGSLLVAPVGFIGDIWRNFGVVGVVISPTIIGGIFLWLKHRREKVGGIKAIVGSYFTVGLTFYWIMGVMFSAGSILMLLVVLWAYSPRLTFSKY